MKNGWPGKKIKGYFDSSDIRFLQNQMITNQNLDYTVQTTEEFRQYLIHFLKTKKFSELADKILNEKIKNLNEDHELVKAHRYLEEFSPKYNNGNTIASYLHYDIDEVRKQASLMNHEYSQIVEQLELENPTDISSSTAKRVQKRLALSNKSGKSIEKKRNQIRANSMGNDDFVRNFLLNKDYIGKYGKFVFNCNEISIKLGETANVTNIPSGSNMQPNISVKGKTKHMSLLYTIGANGSLLDPYVILTGKKDSQITNGIIDGSVAHWNFGRTKDSSIDSPNFLLYLKNTFHPQTCKMVEDAGLTIEQQPRLLLLNGLSSQMNKKIEAFAASKNIELLIIPSRSSGLPQPLDIQFFRGYKSKLFEMNANFFQQHHHHGSMDIGSSRTIKMSIKNQLQIIHSLHKEYHRQSEAIKAAFKRIFIGEDIPNDQVEDMLQKFLDTNENIMHHQDRFYVTPGQQNQIISRDLASGFAMGNNENVSNNHGLRFEELGMRSTFPSAIINNMQDPSSEIEGSHFDIRAEGAKLEALIDETITSKYTSADDFKNIKDTLSHMVPPTAQGSVYKVMHKLIEAVKNYQEYSSSLYNEVDGASSYDESIRKKPRKCMIPENNSAVHEKVMMGTIRRRNIASNVIAENTINQLSNEKKG